MNINIENFSGPLELLLSFVRKNKLDIINIKILDICKQYSEFIADAKEDKQEIASEFIVMLSHLLYIKSKYLLPQEKDKQEADELTTELEKALIEYDLLQKLAEALDVKRNYVSFVTHPQEITPEIIDNSLSELNLAELHGLYRQIIAELEAEEPANEKIRKITEPKRTSIAEVFSEIKYILQVKTKLHFASFIKSKKTNEQKVAAFLAILEAIRNKNIWLKGEYLAYE
ncbi:segregation and condensation protein A [Treponema sp. R6D11]